MGTGFYPRPWAVEPAATWAAPELHTRVFSAFELPTFKPAKRRAAVKPELVGVAAWWANMPASFRAKDARWGANDAKQLGYGETWSKEQQVRGYLKPAERITAYVELGHSQEWARWYVEVVTPAFQNAKRGGLTRREEYATFVAAQSGPAVDKLAKKYVPTARKVG